MIDVLRTPDERFINLPDFSYEPHFVCDLRGYEGLRAAYIDQGPKDAAQTFLCLHGQPTWSFLYRKMIPVFLGSGARVVAPDFFGFGRSDKPADEAVYTFGFHREFLLQLVRRLGLGNITLVVQDWGGLLGLTLPGDRNFRGRLRRLIVMNTTIAVGRSPGAGFLAWRDYCRKNPDLQVGALMGRAVPFLNEQERAAYDAPFPDARYKSGVRRFPEMVMVAPEMEGVEESLQAVEFWSEVWDGRTFMAIGAKDPVLGIDVMSSLQKTIRGCPAPMIVDDGGHFLQEWGEPVAMAAMRALA